MKIASLPLIFIISFAGAQGYHPTNLKKLSAEERISYVKKGIFAGDNTVFKDSTGTLVPDVDALDQTEWFVDLYVNYKGEIVEGIARRIQAEDYALWKQIIDFFQEQQWGVIEPASINCQDQTRLLDEILVTDQNNRKSGVVENLDVDKKNLSLVLGIINTCGFPNRGSVGKNGMTAVFLVLQHSTRKIREQYLRHIKSAAQRGDLSLSEVALMEDRLLMESRQKQKYGSQIVSDEGTGNWKLWPTEDIANVNARRKEMGLGPLEEYVKRWNIVLKD